MKKEQLAKQVVVQYEENALKEEGKKNKAESSEDNYISPSNTVSSEEESKQKSAEQETGVKGQEAALIFGFIPQTYFFLFLIILFICLVFIVYQISSKRR